MQHLVSVNTNTKWFVLVLTDTKLILFYITEKLVFLNRAGQIENEEKKKRRHTYTTRQL